ncbi:hypothetical protein KAW08_06920, partial [bacterium]|nr:hypothetical protein [bacterium]
MAVFIGFTCQWPVTDVCAPFLLGGAKKDKVLIFNSEMIARKYLFLLLALFFTVSLFAASEKEWQEAWNNAYAHGKLEVSVTFGRIDILTDEYAIE